LFRLALALGRADPDALLAELPQRTLLEWIAYYELEPWGEDRADVRAAIVASTVYNVARGRGRARPPRDFLAYRPPPRPMSAAKRALFANLLRPYARPVHDDADGR